MIPSRTTYRTIAAAALVAAFCPAPASAQLFPGLWGRGRCAPCEAPSYAPQTYASASYCSPCATASVAQVATACVQPVQQTVYQEVPVTKYRTVQKSVQVPVMKTAWEERDVTVYKTVNEQKTATVPYTTYQTVSTCQTAQVDNSRWQTTYQRNCKMSPCQYDRRPGFLGWMNRQMYSTRQAFTPNVIARRQYVRDVRTVAQPVTRTIPQTAYREVTYNVAKVVPVTEKRRVAVQRTEMQTRTVAVQEPYTEMRTVAVGTSTQMAFIGGGFGGTATALAPTPAAPRTAEQPVKPRRERTADGGDGTGFGQLNSYENEENERPRDRFSADASARRDGFTAARHTVARPTVAIREPSSAGWAPRTAPKALRIAGWRSGERTVQGPKLQVAAK